MKINTIVAITSQTYPFVSHSQTKLRDLTMSLGKRLAQSNVAEPAIVATRLRMVVSAHRWFAAVAV
jgi:hypothetical protein